MPLHNGFPRFTSGVTSVDLLMASMTAEPFDSHTCTCRQTLVGPEYGIECVASSGSSDRVGAEKHEISVAAFDSHLFYDLFLQGWWGHAPPSPIRYWWHNVHSNRMSNARSAHGPYNLTHLPCFSLSVVHCH